MQRMYAAAAFGLLTGLLTLTPAAPLAVMALAGWFWAVARSTSPARAMFAGAFCYVGAHLWWVGAILPKVFGTWAAAPLVLALYAVEAGFFAALGWLVGRWMSGPARLWALAGGWVVLEWLRGLGPLAFPWPVIGTTLLDTPAIQIADIGGILLVSALVTSTASALAYACERRRWQVLLAPAALLALSCGYGLTRQPRPGPTASAVLARSDVDGFDPFRPGLQEQVRSLAAASVAARQYAGEPVIWPETVLPHAAPQLARFPAPGLVGVGAADGEPPYNAVVALNAAGYVVGQNSKGRPVPLGELFPFGRVLEPLYRYLEGLTGFRLTQSLAPARSMQALEVGGVRYGAYVCYDSVFGWPARVLAAQGAEVLVNVSNDSWFLAAGVGQHFDLGRVRAIETRRWLLRSVQRGVAGSVNDLGQPVEVWQSGATSARSVAYRRLSGKTWYVRWGDAPALTLALGLVGIGAWSFRRAE